MRIRIDEAALPLAMADAWEVNTHACDLPVQLDASQLVATVFSIKSKPLVVGERLRTQAGRFDIESVMDRPEAVQVVLRTWAPGLEARFGITSAASNGGSRIVLLTSVQPSSWIGRVYYRAISPLHHMLMEQVLVRRLRRKSKQLASAAE